MIVGLGDVVTSKEKRIDFDYDIDLSSIEISGEYPFVDPVTVYGSVEDKNGHLPWRLPSRPQSQRLVPAASER